MWEPEQLDWFASVALLKGNHSGHRTLGGTLGGGNAALAEVFSPLAANCTPSKLIIELDFERILESWY